MAAAPVASKAAREPLAGGRVLVVDGHLANHIVLDGQIRQLGALPRLAENGRVALAQWPMAQWSTAPDTIDVILTDCSMPEMSGEQLAQAIRADEAQRQSSTAVPIVGLTANAQPEASARAIAAGMTACLVKPIGLDALRDALASAARHASPSPQAATESVADNEAPAFDVALLAAFGDQSAALVDTRSPMRAGPRRSARRAARAGLCAARRSRAPDEGRGAFRWLRRAPHCSALANGRPKKKPRARTMSMPASRSSPPGRLHWTRSTPPSRVRPSERGARVRMPCLRYVSSPVCSN